MRKVLLAFSLLILQDFAQAQYVTIPDANFRLKLKAFFQSCFNGDLLDTTCAASHPADFYWGINKNDDISSVEGIQYFKNLIGFSCYDSPIHKISSLPISLIRFDCINCQLTMLPALPSHLELFNCSNNQLDSLPSLPNTLRELVCDDNPLKILPTLPSSLTELSCMNGHLTSLPELPIYLSSLECSNNLLTSLPELPINLEGIKCNNNPQLAILPDLPQNLSVIDITGTSIQCVPNKPWTLNGALKNYPLCNPSDFYAIPDSNFRNALQKGVFNPRDCFSDTMLNIKCANNFDRALSVSSSNITSLKGIEYFNKVVLINCSNNKLTSLPNLPSGLRTLFCDSNSLLTCLPVLPSKLDDLSINGTKISCLPNKPVSLSSNFSICSPLNNRTNCQSYPVLSGRIFIDENKNGRKDANEFFRKGIQIMVESSDYYTYSNDSGYYEILVDSIKTYTISTKGHNYYISNSHTETPTYMGEILSHDFALQPTKIAKDLKLTITNYHRIARGFGMPFKVEIENIGTLDAPATISFDFPSNFIVNSISDLGKSIGNNVWYYPNLLPGQKISGYIDGFVSATIPIGDSLRFTAYVNQNDMEDSSLENNTSRLNLLVYGSLDPNDKAGPSTINPVQVAKSEFIEYTIRFQNVGNTPAVNLVIADTLSQNLLPNTLELISTSHICKTTVKGSQVYFEFLNIMLPDSVNHEKESHGYVRFRVKPKKTLVLGNTISNTSSIYFDYNSPVVTNTVFTKVSQPIITSTSELETPKHGLSIFPNPLKEFLNVNIDELMTGSQFELLEISGQSILKQAIKNNQTQIDISDLKAGTYLYRFSTNDGLKFGKVVKQ